MGQFFIKTKPSVIKMKLFHMYKVRKKASQTAGPFQNQIHPASDSWPFYDRQDAPESPSEKFFHFGQVVLDVFIELFCLMGFLCESF